MARNTVIVQGTFELDGWTLVNVSGPDMPADEVSEEACRDQLLAYFQDTFITTYPPQVHSIKIDSLGITDWEAVRDVEAEDDDASD